MKELLDKILATDLLNEDTRNELQSAILAQIEEAKATAREEAIVEAKAEYAAEFVAAKEALIEAIDSKVQEFLNKELEELKEDISSFRDLEAEYAAKLVDEKHNLAKVLESDMTELVNTLDAFLEVRLTEEFTELRESIEEVKKLEFGRTIFEAVQNEFTKNFFDKDEATVKLREKSEELENVQKQLKESKKTLDSISRNTEMTKVLENLQGRPREIMEAILKNTPTEKLNETYETFIERVLHESVKGSASVDKTEKEIGDKSSEVLAESTATGGNPATKVVTGDTPIVENDSSKLDAKPALDPSALASLRKLAGLNG